MATMYEMIMDLPLLKGLGKEQVSQFLEKTNLGFIKYADGETIIGKGDDVSMLKFVMSGAVKIIHVLESLPVRIEEICGAGNVLGADRLFGISTGYASEVVSEGNSSIMQFSKEQYMNLLQSDRIYMLNFVNYLSLRAQRPVESVGRFAGGGLSARLGLILSIITMPSSYKISIMASDSALAELGNVSEAEVRDWKKRSAKEGLISVSGSNLRILSRSDFLARI